MSERVRDLPEELVCDDEPETVFSRFGEDLRESLSREVLELIDIEKEGDSTIFIRSSSPHSRLIDLRHEHRTEESHDLFLESSFRELDQEDFFCVHDLSEIEFVL